MDNEQELTATARTDRRQSLMKATFDTITAEGFEGLRTRTVAKKAGVNISTLHYYFPTKEALIGAFAHYLGGIFMNTHAPAVPSSGHAGLDRLRQEFADTAFYMAEHQDLMRVMGELGMRAQRDPVVKSNLDLMLHYWRRSIAETVRLGVEDGSFRTDTDPEKVTTTLIALFSGCSVIGPDKLDAVRQTVEQWLVNPAIEREQHHEPETA